MHQLTSLLGNSERTEAVTIEVQSPQVEQGSFSFPAPSTSASAVASPAIGGEASAAQKVTPWDVQGATVEGKQVSSD